MHNFLIGSFNAPAVQQSENHTQIIFLCPAGVRPVPLEIHIQGFDISNLESRMQAMARPAYSSILTHAPDGAPAIVFVPTRKHARLVAFDLLAFAASDGRPQRFLQV